MKETLLKTEKLCKSFSNGGTMQHVLRNIDLELHKGDFTIIMGASGAGKSTLLYALSGMDMPSVGTITFGGQAISGLCSDELAVFRRRHCGFVFQQICLIDTMSVMDNVPGSCLRRWGFPKSPGGSSPPSSPGARPSGWGSSGR